MPQPTDRKELLFEDPYSRLLNKRELGRYLGQSPNAVDLLRKKRVIPCLIVGGNVRFRLVDVEKAIIRYQGRVRRANFGPPRKGEKKRPAKRQAQEQGQEAVA